MDDDNDADRFVCRQVARRVPCWLLFPNLPPTMTAVILSCFPRVDPGIGMTCPPLPSPRSPPARTPLYLSDDDTYVICTSIRCDMISKSKQNSEFFVQERKLGTAREETLWHDRYRLDLCLLPKFIDEEVAVQILTIGKAINFLRRLCGDSEWIMGPMAKASWLAGCILSSAACDVSDGIEAYVDDCFLS